MHCEDIYPWQGPKNHGAGDEGSAEDQQQDCHQFHAGQLQVTFPSPPSPQHHLAQGRSQDPIRVSLPGQGVGKEVMEMGERWREEVMEEEEIEGGELEE